MVKMVSGVDTSLYMATKCGQERGQKWKYVKKSLAKIARRQCILTGSVPHTTVTGFDVTLLQHLPYKMATNTVYTVGP